MKNTNPVDNELFQLDYQIHTMENNFKLKMERCVQEKHVNCSCTLVLVRLLNEAHREWKNMVGHRWSPKIDVVTDSRYSASNPKYDRWGGQLSNWQRLELWYIKHKTEKTLNADDLMPASEVR